MQISYSVFSPANASSQSNGSFMTWKSNTCRRESIAPDQGDSHCTIPVRSLIGMSAVESGTSLLAREIAIEVARLLKRGDEPSDPDLKGLRNIRPVLLNIEQTAKYLGRTVKGVRDLEKKGVLVPVRFDRKIQFRRRDSDDAMERHSA